MARSLAACVGLSALVCVTGRGLLSDGLALHQQLVRPGRAVPEAPSKSAAKETRPVIREAVDNVLKRATAKLKLPEIPAVFRWDLVGRVTNWAMTRYQKPKPPAALALVDEALSFYGGIVGSKDFPTLDDAELVARFSDVNKLHQMVQHYMEKASAPPAVKKLVDTVVETARSKGTLDAASTAQLAVDIANQTSGPALAELVAYVQTVAAGKAQLDQVHILDLEVPVLTDLGAPPAVADFLHETARMVQSNITEEPDKGAARVERMLAKSAEQLGMPSALSEILDYLAGLTVDSMTTHVFEKPRELQAVLAHVNELHVKLNDQLGSLSAHSKLIELLGRPLKTGSAPATEEIFQLLAQLSREAGQPGTVAELLEYLSPIVAHNQSANSEKALDLMLKLSGELGLPAPAIKVIKDARAQALKKGTPLDSAKLAQMVTQLLRKLSMPAFADIFGHLAVPMITKGKQPDALALAAVAPSLMKITSDFDAADSLSRGMRAKLFGPLMPVHDLFIEKLTGKMPESTFKNVLRHALHSMDSMVEA